MNWADVLPSGDLWTGSVGGLSLGITRRARDVRGNVSPSHHVIIAFAKILAQTEYFLSGRG